MISEEEEERAANLELDQVEGRRDFPSKRDLTLIKVLSQRDPIEEILRHQVLGYDLMLEIAMHFD